MLDRLRLDEKRLAAMAAGVRAVAALTDPVGETLRAWTRPNGFEINKVRVPIGVVGHHLRIPPQRHQRRRRPLHEDRQRRHPARRQRGAPLEPRHRRRPARRRGFRRAAVDCIQLIARPDREAVRLLAEMDRYVDLIDPAGGTALIETVVRHARMPVIKHYHGVCILYVDRAADQDMAVKIVVDAKCQRPGVCNAVETLLGAPRGRAPSSCRERLRTCGSAASNCAATRRPAACSAEGTVPATEADWNTEFLDLKLAVKVVGGLDEAVAHIETHGSHHSDAIVTADAACAERFLNEVDSATVYWNASTRFTDGGEFGFGAEIGISTDKLHARGPMALEELTTYKYVIRGTGQVRE